MILVVLYIYTTICFEVLFRLGGKGLIEIVYDVRYFFMAKFNSTRYKA
jgi:hypothetical protein